MKEKREISVSCYSRNLFYLKKRTNHKETKMEVRFNSSTVMVHLFLGCKKHKYTIYRTDKKKHFDLPNTEFNPKCNHFFQGVFAPSFTLYTSVPGVVVLRYCLLKQKKSQYYLQIQKQCLFSNSHQIIHLLYKKTSSGSLTNKPRSIKVFIQFAFRSPDRSFLLQNVSFDVSFP